MGIVQHCGCESIDDLILDDDDILFDGRRVGRGTRGKFLLQNTRMSGGNLDERGRKMPSLRTVQIGVARDGRRGAKE